MERAITTLTPIPPYDFDLTAAHATHFRGRYGAESVQDGVFRRLLDLGGRLCLVNVRSLGTMDAPSLEVELKGATLNDAVVSEALSQVARLLGVEQDLGSFYQMAFKDPKLTLLVRELRGLHAPQNVSVWESLVLAILGQQVSSHVAHMMRTLLVETYGLSRKASAVTYHTFPSPEVLMTAGVEGLQSIKLSKRKAEYIVDIAGMVASGELDLEALRGLPDHEVVHTLTSLRGVGSWTAHWVLIRGLGRTDAFPHGDLALRRTLGLLFKDDRLFNPEKALKYSRRWTPFRSYVTTYIFAAIRSGRFPELSQTGVKMGRL